jgi:hypothetical protein
MRRRTTALTLAALTALAVTGCGSKKELIHVTSVQSTVVQTQTTSTTGRGTGSPPGGGQAVQTPLLATKNTTRVAGSDPVSDAAGVALAVYPSVISGTHPTAVVLAPTDDWQASLAASVFMAGPVRAPLLLSGRSGLPAATYGALAQLAPTGAGTLDGAQIIRIGDVPAPKHLRVASVSGSGPYALAAAIDRVESAAAGRPTADVVIASGDSPAYAMPAAGWAAESGQPILFVSHSQVPAATRQALASHGHPHIYVLGPASVIPDSVLTALGKYGPVKRVGASDPAANSATFAAYRDPACPVNQPCVHQPGTFGWALRSPGHGYTLLNAARPLDAAAAAALSASGSFGPELVVNNASALPSSLLNFFLNYATPGYTQEGPTAAVYNHGWVIGDQNAISVAVQAEVDSLLEAIPQR